MPKLTEGFADKIEVPAGKRDVLVFDGGHADAVRGFGIRKYADGQSVYIVKYSVNRQTRRHSLGAVRRGNLKKMRDLAEEVKARGRLGQDIIGEKKARVAEKQAAQSAATVGALVDIFQKERELMTRKVVNGRPVTPTLRDRTHEATERFLKIYFKPLHPLVVGTVTRGTQVGVVDLDKRWLAINGHKLEIVARSHVVDVIDDIAKNRGKVAADRCKAALSTFFAWAIDQGFCDLNPSMHIKARSTNGARERALSDQELAEVWRACPDNDYGKIVRLLLLSGQRKQEIGGLRWSEIDLGERVIKLPSERVKNWRAHAVWLSDQALAIIKSMPTSGTRDLVFGRGADGYSGWTASKAKLDARIAEARAKAGRDDIDPWCIHDLRRSFSTRANELGLGEPHQIEAVLNHIVGGTAGVYNKSQLEAGKRKVLEAWGAHITKLVSQPQKVTAGKSKEKASRSASVTAP